MAVVVPNSAQPYTQQMMGQPQIMGQPQMMTAQLQVFTVQVPAGGMPGQAMSVQAPSGQMLQVQIPEGMGPGSTFQVADPTAAAMGVVMQQPGLDPAAVQAKVHATLRDGKWGVVTSADAIACASIYWRRLPSFPRPDSRLSQMATR